jgi:hypothetical protein
VGASRTSIFTRKELNPTLPSRRLTAFVENGFVIFAQGIIDDDIGDSTRLLGSFMELWITSVIFKCYSIWNFSV